MLDNQEKYDNLSAQEILKDALEKYGDKVALASSFGAEDVVVIDMMMKIDPAATVFTLDTGRLNQETYDVMDAVRRKYGLSVKTMFPEATAVAEMVEKAGFNLFYDSLENRKLCCKVRKVLPLRRALGELDAWITGLRREQAVTRADLHTVEWDEGFGLLKLNPIANWTEADVWNYIKENEVPYNALHDRGYPSIGCQPCTRAIKPGEDVRAGRWWWETPEQKECGLHVKQEKA